MSRQVWRPTLELHARFSKPTRQQISTALLLASEDPPGTARRPQCELHTLPIELLCYLFEIIAAPNARDYSIPVKPRLFAPNASFGLPRSATVTPDGDIVVAEPDVVRVFTREGKIVCEVPFYEVYGVYASGPDIICAGSNAVAENFRGCRMLAFRKDDAGKHWRSKGLGLASLSPKGVTETASGELIATDVTNRVYVFAPDGQLVRSFGGSGGGEGQFYIPWGVTTLFDGSIAVVDQLNQRIQLWRPDGTFLRSLSTSPALHLPTEITVDAEGNLVVCDQCNHRVVVMRPDDGSVVWTFGDKGKELGQFLCPMGVAVLPDGSILVCDTYNHRVQII